MRSFRGRVILGWVLWSLGAITIAIAVGSAIVHRHPEWARVLHSVLLTLVAIASVIVGLTQMRRGLSPFSQLRSRLTAVLDGRERHVDGRYPAEVQPLVDELNMLLDQREQAIARASAKAGDLAHGLKTPLAVLAQEAIRASAAGHHELAATIGQQVTRMQRQIDYHLAHARAVASGPSTNTRSMLLPIVEALVRTMQRLYAEREIVFDVRVDPQHAARCDREDLEEMLGNLLDNACKWTRRQIRIESVRSNDRVTISVDDDGSGLEPSMREAVLERGVRADETSRGWGLGLAIVRDLAELRGGSVALDQSTLGGLRATLRLPV